MGRPLNSRIFGPTTGPNLTLQFASAWIPGESAAAANCYIVKQTATASFVAMNPATGKSGVVTLAQTVTAAGQAVLPVAPQGAGVGAQVSAILGLSHVAVAAAGTGYAVGDTLTVVGGTLAVAAAVLTVSTIGSGGTVTGVTITSPGSYKVLISGAAATTTNHAGTGCTVTVSGWKVAYLAIVQGGADYSSATLTIAGGGGSGAAATVAIAAGAVSTTNLTAAGDNYTSIPQVTVTSPVALLTAKKVLSTKVITFEGPSFNWHADTTVPSNLYAALPLI